jgi:phosphohistidine phosphatase
MKTLFLLRHAKSSWDNPNISDFERPLNKRGLETAPFIGKLLYDRKIQPDLILSSPAKRAKQTAILVKETGELSVEINYEDNIYEASPLRLLEILSKVNDEAESILLVGHNPGLESLIRILSGEIHAIQTCVLTKLNLNIEKWNEISSDCGEIEFIIRPKEEM